jgi:L-alanine-DL-glutamate epimerase-like enolase superfamily enzyme
MCENSSRQNVARLGEIGKPVERHTRKPNSKENRMVDSINTGTAKAGSFAGVRRIAELCEQNRIRCALSNTAASRVGDAAAVHLASATPGISLLCELGEFEVISGDPFFGLSVEHGTINVPEGERLGVGLRGF